MPDRKKKPKPTARRREKPYSRDDFTPEFCEEQVALHGGSRERAAAALAPLCRGVRKPTMTPRGVLHWITVALNGLEDAEMLAPAESEIVNRLAKLVREANLPVESIGRLKTVRLNSWGVHAKDPETGEIRTKDLYSTQILLEPKERYEPAWPVVQPAAPTIITYRPRQRRAWKAKTHVVLPDHQVGFLRDLDEIREGSRVTTHLHPIHDRAAIDVAQQIVADLEPDGLGHLGDFFDFTEMSRWPQHEEFWRTTQLAVDEGGVILADYEAAAGPPRRRLPTWWLEGNHDRRLEDYIRQNARAAFGLRRSTETPGSWPALTVGALLGFDALGYEYCGAYPHSEKWLVRGRGGLVARHNPLRKNAYDAVQLVGHTHRVRPLVDYLRGSEGRARTGIIESGCLCRVDDDVPKRRLMRTPVPSDRAFIDGWQQAVVVITVDGERWSYEIAEIFNGECNFRGRRYAAPKRLRRVA